MVMLDKKTTAVMHAINEICSDGSYKVVETEDLLAQIPAKLRLDKAGLIQAVNFLKERDYISVKFSGEDEYCLCSLPKGRTFVEHRVEQKKETHKSFKNYLLISFFGAMLGAFIGSCVFWFIYSLFLK